MSKETRKPANNQRRQNRSSLIQAPVGVNYAFEIQAQLLEAQTMPDLMEIASSMLARVPGTIGGWIYQRDDRGELSLVHSWQATGTNLTSPTGSDLGRTIHQRWIAAHRLGNSSPEFAKPFAPTGFPATLAVPMLIGEELIGALAVERREGVHFPYAPEDIVTLATIAGLTAQQMQLLVLRRRVADIDTNEMRDEILNQEHRRIARELHDGIVQDMAYMRLKIEMLERVIPEQPARATSEAREVRDHLNLSISNLREMIANLRKPRQRSRGITGELRDLATRLGTSDAAFELALSEISGVRLAPEIERAVVGIVREALQNIRKHANASSIHVEVQRENEELHVVVSDDGSGIGNNPPVTDNDQHFGLDQMRELAEEMGGSLGINSGQHGGTRIDAKIPLTPATQEGMKEEL